MITLLLGCVFVVALATAALMLLVMLQGANYDQWVREFEEKGGIQWPVADVLDGSTVVATTYLGERRTNRS